MNRSRVEIAKPKIVSYFGSSPQKVLVHGDVEDILSQERDDWKLAKGMSTASFLMFLLREGILNEIKLPFPHKAMVRYVSNGSVTIYDIAATLKTRGYFSHGTAAYLHGLRASDLEEPKVVYVNEEQDKDNSHNGELKQESIDNAFKRRPRVSNNKAKLRDYTICILNGMNTGRLGVTDYDNNGTSMAITSVERTLIDAAVRPVYCGGVHGVLETYRNAKGKFSFFSLADMYERLHYTYPYHQAIGFYLDAAGVYSPTATETIYKLPRKFDFYLTNEMVDAKYSKKWKIYYPSYLDKLLPNNMET